MLFYRNIILDDMFSAIRSLRCKHCIFVLCSVILVLYLCNGLVNRMHGFEKERKVVMPAVRVIPPGQPPHIFNTEGEILGTSTKIPKIIHQTWKTTKVNASIIKKIYISSHNKLMSSLQNNSRPAIICYRTLVVFTIHL